MRMVAMIPARLGSKRVKKKNLRMLGDKPLIAHMIETACGSGLFDDVYVNSESKIFEGIAGQYGARFYHRPPHLASDEATNDEFALDFINAVSCDVLIQLNPTSPFLTVDDMRSATEMFKKDFDTVLATKEMFVEGLCKGVPINFRPTGKMPLSQQLEPIRVFCNGILAWRTELFRRNMETYGCAVYGGDGRTGYCVLKGQSTIDIDTDEDFSYAELLWKLKGHRKAPARYWDEMSQASEHEETDVSSILKKDGVETIHLKDVNHEVLHLTEIIEKRSRDRSWSKRIIDSGSNCVTIISQMPGEGNRLHYHRDWDEWWLILEGEWEYVVDGRAHRVQKGDVVYIERNRIHQVTAKGATRAVRMAVSRDDVAHIYPEKSQTVTEKVTIERA